PMTRLPAGEVRTEVAPLSRPLLCETAERHAACRSDIVFSSATLLCLKTICRSLTWLRRESPVSTKFRASSWTWSGPAWSHKLLIQKKGMGNGTVDSVSPAHSGVKAEGKRVTSRNDDRQCDGSRTCTRPARRAG